jgi:tripartite-type tricarboxylate transporter receptor subunit TctC
MLTRRRLFGVTAGATLVLTFRLEAQATNRIVVAFPPGGTADIVARNLAEALSQRLGSSFIVENKPGAGTALGTQAVIKAAADGRTLLLGGTSQVINHALKGGQLGFDVRRDLVPLGIAASMPVLVVAGPSTEVTSLPGLIALSAQRREPLTFASSGTGSSSHLAGELFARRAGISLLHVPYRGASAAFTDLIAGRIDLMFPNTPEAIGQLDQQGVRALAVAAAQRASSLPATQTAGEQGIADFEISVLLGLMAPVGTPQQELERLSNASEASLQDPDLQARFRKLGIESFPWGRGPMEEAMNEEFTRWTSVIASAGIKL